MRVSLAASTLVVVLLVVAALGAAHRGTFAPSERVRVVSAELQRVDLPPQPRTTSTSALVVRGTLRNVDVSDSALVRVKVTFFDGAGQLLMTSVGYPDAWGVQAVDEVPFVVVAPVDPRVASVRAEVEEAPEPGLRGLSLRALLEGLKT